jgi:hypothetical protein
VRINYANFVKRIISLESKRNISKTDKRRIEVIFLSFKLEGKAKRKNF